MLVCVYIYTHIHTHAHTLSHMHRYTYEKIIAYSPTRTHFIHICNINKCM